MLWSCLTSLHLPQEPGFVVGDILPAQLGESKLAVKAALAP